MIYSLCIYSVSFLLQCNVLFSTFRFWRQAFRLTHDAKNKRWWKSTDTVIRILALLPWYPSCNDSLEWPSAVSPGESLVLSFQSWDACVEDQTQRALTVQKRVAGNWDQYTVKEHVNSTLSEEVCLQLLYILKNYYIIVRLTLIAY